MILTAAMTVTEIKQPPVTVPRAPVSRSSELPDRPKTASQLDYRPDIDGLRAIAVLAVIGFHAFPTWIRGGFVGVDVFFVISGYLISTILLAGMERGSFRFSQFYIRRIRRIFPALIVVLLACMVAGWLVLFSFEYKALGKHVAGSTAFVSNFVLWNEAGYFDKAAATKPLLHIWSLGIEEQFYIAWPLLLFLVWKRKAATLAILLLLLFGSFAFNVHAVVDPAADFYSPLTRFWELMAGAVLAYLSLYSPGPQWINQELSPTRDSWLNRRGGAAPLAVNNVKAICGLLLIVASRFDDRRDQRLSGLVGITAGCRHVPDDCRRTKHLDRQQAAGDQSAGRHRPDQLSALSVALAAFVVHSHRQWNGTVAGSRNACDPAQLRAGLADLFARGKAVTFRQIGASQSCRIVGRDGGDRLGGIFHLCQRRICLPQSERRRPRGGRSRF